MWNASVPPYPERAAHYPYSPSLFLLFFTTPTPLHDPYSPCRWDYARIRKICDATGAFMFVDMAHISGLVATGEPPNVNPNPNPNPNPNR